MRLNCTKQCVSWAVAYFSRSVAADMTGEAKCGLEWTRPASEERIAAAWQSLGGRPAVAEKALDLECEISVMAVRSPSGEVRSYPAARNHHENQILAWSVLPASVSPELESRAETLAAGIIDRLGLEGLLCVEIFVTRQGELLVNELAPRPHNSYHQSERGCVTSQFEQLVRAVCNLPLGSTELTTPAAIVNLLGDVWLEGKPDFAAALAVPGVRIHLYEKHTPRAGRKMGHLSATGSTAEEALARVLEAKQSALACLLNLLPPLGTTILLQNLFAQPQRLRRHFDKLIVGNEFDGLFQVHRCVRHQANRIIGCGCAHVGHLLFAHNVHIQIVITRVLAYNHAFVNFNAGPHK